MSQSGIRRPLYFLTSSALLIVFLMVAWPARAWDAGNPYSECKQNECTGGVRSAKLGWLGVLTNSSRVADCPEGYTNNGLTCGRGADSFGAGSRVADCPSGYTNMGLYCGKGLTMKGPDSMTCPAGYFKSGVRCNKLCPPGYTNTGETCYRGPSTLGMSSMKCNPGERLDSGRCFAVPSAKLRGNTHLWVVNQSLALLSRSSDPVAVAAVARMRSPGCQPEWQTGLYGGDEPGFADDPVDKNTAGSHFYNAAQLDAFGNPTPARTYLAAALDVSINTQGKFNPSAREKAAERIQRAAGISGSDAGCRDLGFALHYLTDMTQPMHATSFSGMSAPLMLHPYFEGYVPKVQNRFPQSGTWAERWKGSTPDRTFHEVALRSGKLAPGLMRSLIRPGKECTLEGVELGAPYRGFCFLDDPAVDAQIGIVLQDAYQSTASYIYNVFASDGGGGATNPPEGQSNPPSSEGAFRDTCDIGEIRVSAGWVIDGFQVVCRDGRTLPQRGGAGGSPTSFVLQPGEQLRAVSGSAQGEYGPYVYSLQFHTDRRSSPVYGNGGTSKGTQPFRLEANAGSRVTGLSGRAGQYLMEVGIVEDRVLQEHVPQTPAPIADTPFSDVCEIGEIKLHAGWWIDGLQLGCRDGRKLSQRGGTGGSPTSFVLQPGEEIRAISGSTHGEHGPYVYSLQFHTNRRSSPVYGNGGNSKGTRPFRFEAAAGSRVTGLNGIAGRYLLQVGIVQGPLQLHGDPIAAPGPAARRPVDYNISISTGTASGAGTDANVFVTIDGTRGSTGEVRLNGMISGNAFESGQTDGVTLRAIPDLGEILAVTIRHDNQYSGAGWQLSGIQVYATGGRNYQFSCGCWLEGDRNQTTLRPR